MSKTTRFLQLTLTVLVLTLIVSVNHVNAELTLNMDKSVIPIDAFYKGNTLTVTGSVESGHDVVVRVTSPRENESFMVKEKSIHLFWMNKYKVNVTKVHNTYMLLSSKGIDDVLPAAEKSKYSLGYDAIKKSVDIKGDDTEDDKDTLFSEFIKLKEKGKLYVVSGHSVTLTPSSEGKNNYSVTVKFPYQVPMGSYNVDVYAVKDGLITQRVTGSVKIRLVGIGRKISDMAMTHGGVYGLLAVLIALITGYVVTPAIAVARRVMLIAIVLPRRVFAALTAIFSSSST
ncbi:TIGR02186 family protein [Candidatus Magnetomonas plexicatena]|uniref:TIGR02186 family protein n=1 Tax=Candidatus Magnetomonas plexicatena TaxID=2552947 RepID=UPI001C78B0E0|nr:hypothetical protein E2O03_005500 [Nitrospirales bacterium LBB_01]